MGRAVRCRSVLELLDHAQARGRLDRLEHLEAMLLVVTGRPQAALRLERRDAGEVTIELGREEADAPHLTLGHDLDAGVLLVAQRHVDGVVLDLADVAGPNSPRSAAATARSSQPGWACGADHRGGQGTGAIGFVHRHLLGRVAGGPRVSRGVDDGPTAVDGQRLTGDRARPGREQVQRRVSDVLGWHEATGRGVACDARMPA